MPRDVSGVYALPSGSIVTDGVDDIQASQHNTPLQDLAADANAVRPIVAGGTGASSADGALAALGGTTDGIAMFKAASAAAQRALLAPGQAVISGTASDINASTYALLGSTPNFVATSTIVMVACDLVASKTTAANIVQVLGRLWNVTTGLAHGSVVEGRHGQGPSAGAVTAAYSAHTSGLIGGLTVGQTYRLDVLALKQVAEGPLAIDQYRGSVFNI